MEQTTTARTVPAQTATERTAAVVRAELAKRKINGTQLALALGWSRATTWRRLNAAVPFGLDELAAVAEYLGLSLADLIPAESRPVASVT